MDCFIDGILQQNTVALCSPIVGETNTRCEEVERDTIPTEKFSRKSSTGNLLFVAHRKGLSANGRTTKTATLGAAFG